ncbi:DUF808 domain-containing protein, partial [Micromonospora sp. NPDC005324]
GGLVGWLVNTVASAILGLIVGALVVVVMTLTLHRRKSKAAAATAAGPTRTDGTIPAPASRATQRRDAPADRAPRG